MTEHSARRFDPRKTPVQTRSTFTVEAIFDATIQVLLERGKERLTTTRVAERAGVSVGTLYQYFPHKEALLSAVLSRHLHRIGAEVERACRQQYDQPVAKMMEAVVAAFIAAKMSRADEARALYAVSSDVDGVALVIQVSQRASKAISSMLVTASDYHVAQAELTAFMVFSAMRGATQSALELGISPGMMDGLTEQLIVLCRRYVESVSMKRRFSV
jgi:AcrR family transcriptional regulator